MIYYYYLSFKYVLSFETLIIDIFFSFSFALTYVPVLPSQSVPVSPSQQEQLIHDKSTNPPTPATPQSPSADAETPGAAVQMTWTEAKCDGEQAKPVGATTPEAIKDLFNMKPWVQHVPKSHLFKNRFAKVWI